MYIHTHINLRRLLTSLNRKQKQIQMAGSSSVTAESHQTAGITLRRQDQSPMHLFPRKMDGFRLDGGGDRWIEKQF